MKEEEALDLTLTTILRRTFTLENLCMFLFGLLIGTLASGGTMGMLT